MPLTGQTRQILDEALARNGLRATRQREHVFAILLGQRDHPSAEEVYARAREEMPTISLATVYNCLETLVECGLVRQVTIERGASRYCPNLAKHAHFHDRKTGRIYDIDLPEDFRNALEDILPHGYELEDFELSFTGATRAQDNGNP